MMRHNHHAGFTLVEILVALFIFTILSMMMTGGLHTIITAQSGADRSADRLRALQIVFVRLSRDIEQIVNRPVKTTNGQDASAFYGTPKGFAFTHGGLAGQEKQHQVLQRTQYSWSRAGLWRMVWDVLDQAANSPKPSQRQMLENVSDVRFEYVDEKNAYHKEWPISGASSQPLPHAVRISLTFADWGTVRQIYVIPVQVSTIPETQAAKPKS